MGAILAGVVVAIVVAVGVGYFLPTQQEPAWEVYTSSSTRVGDPGQNLVGPGWTGEGGVQATEPAESPN